MPGRIFAVASADVSLKGVVPLLHAVAALRQRRALDVVILGEARRNGAVERTMKELGLGGTVRFVRGIDEADVARQYAEAEVAVVPSLYEGFSILALQAMSCGVPLVATPRERCPRWWGGTARRRCCGPGRRCRAGARDRQAARRPRPALPAERGRSAPSRGALQLGGDRSGHRRRLPRGGRQPRTMPRVTTTTPNTTITGSAKASTPPRRPLRRWCPRRAARSTSWRSPSRSWPPRLRRRSLPRARAARGRQPQAGGRRGPRGGAASTTLR